MKLKRHINFINSQCDIEFINESVSIHEGDFKVTEDMVSNGKMIPRMIPREVTGNFDCSNNQLTSLIGCPELVGGSFNCSHNQLLSLYGGPKKVADYFDCSNNLLTSLKGSPKSIEDVFYCYNNKLITLDGGPETVDGYFYCNDNLLTSLEGGPSKIDGSFICQDNNLTTLEGGPKNFSSTIYVGKGLEIEEGFIEAGKYINEYWMDLLKYMISNHINLTEITSWPMVFIDSLEPKYRNILISTKQINKFKL